MADKTKISLRNALMGLTVATILCSIVGAAYIAQDNAKTAKAVATTALLGVQEVKTKQARFEGKMDERTANTAKRVDDIYDIVKEWGPK